MPLWPLRRNDPVNGGRIAALALCLVAAACPVMAQVATVTGDRPPPRPQVVDQPEPSPPAPDETAAPPVWQELRETPQDYAACKLALSVMGSSFQELPPLRDDQNAECGIARPIRLTAPIPDVVIEGGAVMRCSTARALALWVHDFVRPAAGALPGAPRLNGMITGTTYDCRGRIGSDPAARLSEHAFGNAIDIAALTFSDGSTLPIQPRTDDGNLAEAFQRALRGTACLYFTTVLGPGTDPAHADHLHLDIRDRKGDWRLCQ